MKKINWTLVSVIIAVFTCFQSYAATIELVPASATALPGTSFDVALTISGLGDYASSSLGEFDIDISYNSSILAFNNAVFGDPDPLLGDQLDLFGFGFPIQVVAPSSGSVNLFELSFNTIDELVDYQAGAFTLATLKFDALAAGKSDLILTPITLGDESGAPLSVTVANSSITVVPEPSTISLFILGIVGLGVFANYKK